MVVMKLYHMVINQTKDNTLIHNYYIKLNIFYWNKNNFMDQDQVSVVVDTPMDSHQAMEFHQAAMEYHQAAMEYQATTPVLSVLN